MLDPQMLRQWGLYGALGLEMVLSILVPIFVGFYLDKKWNTSPWLLLLGVGLGLAAAIVFLVKTTRLLSKEEET